MAPEIRELELDGVFEITPVRHGDARGWFSETWSRRDLAAGGIEIDWVQDNESLSVPQFTLRGIHYQLPPHGQDKLVRVVQGRILDVAVDLRRDSSTFGRWVGVELSAEVGNQLMIPAGFGHAFCTLEENCRVAYKTSAFYAPESDRAIRFDDPTIGIDWPAPAEQLLTSAKDQAAPLLDTAEVF